MHPTYRSARTTSSLFPKPSSRFSEPLSTNRSPARIVSFLLASLLAVALTPQFAWAQRPQRPREPQQPEEGTEVPASLRFADLKLGPLYLQPRVALKSFGWDSNVLGRSDPLGQISDFRITPSAGLKLAVPFQERHMLSADGEVDYLWFKENDDLRTFNTAFWGKYEYTSDRWDFEIENRFVDADRTQLDLIEIGGGEVPPGADIFERVRELTNRLGAVARWNLTTRVYVEARGSRRLVRYDPEDSITGIRYAEELNRTEESGGVAFGYKIWPTSSIAVIGDWDLYGCEKVGNPRDAETSRAGARVEMSPVGTVSGELLVAYRDLAPREPDLVGYTGIVLEADIALRPGGIVEIHLLADRDIFPTYWRDNTYALRQGGGLSFRRPVSRSLAIEGRATMHEASYPIEATEISPEDGSEITAKRLDRVYRFDGRVEWRLSQSTTLGFRVGYINRISNFPRLDMDGFIIGSSYSLVY